MEFAALLAAAVTKPPLALDLGAVFLGGLSGALFAVQRRMPITGVLALAFVTGLGGGLIRDVLLDLPPVALDSYWYIPVLLAAVLIGFYFTSVAHHTRLAILVLDPIWMGMFAVIGAQKTLNVGYTGWAAIVVGVICGAGGGVLRDVIAGETPEIVTRGPINYFAIIPGTALYVVLVQRFGVDKIVSEIAAVTLVFGLRMLAVKFDIKAPEPVDIPRKVPQVVRGRRRRPRRKP